MEVDDMFPPDIATEINLNQNIILARQHYQLSIHRQSFS
jgi:hypothetical protein